MNDQGSEKKMPDGIDPIKTQIDENLKRVYQSALVEEVPDRFKLLLQQLKAKEAGK
jgi:hypothetical protein